MSRLSSGAMAKPHEITPYMLLGSFMCARNRPLLDSLGITHVVNVTKDCPNCFEDAGVRYLRIPIEDVLKADLTPWVQRFLTFVATAAVASAPVGDLEDGGKKGPAAAGPRPGRVLVHCQMGISRSPSFVITQLVCGHGMDLETALAWVQKRRPMVQPNPAFMRQLAVVAKNAHKYTAASDLPLEVLPAAGGTAVGGAVAGVTAALASASLVARPGADEVDGPSDDSDVDF
jgi:hypothetical protein